MKPDNLEMFLLAHWFGCRPVIKSAFEKYADLTQDGVSRLAAFRDAFPGVDPFQWISDGYLSQYYCGPDRNYDTE